MVSGSLESFGGDVTVNAAITAGTGAALGDVSLSAIGDITVQSVSADRDVSLYGVGGAISASSVSVGRDYRLNGSSFNLGALSPNTATHRNRAHTVLALGATATHPTAHEVGEDITVEKVPPVGEVPLVEVVP